MSKFVVLKSRLNSDTAILFFLFFSAFIVRIIFLLYTDNILGMDPMGRLEDGLSLFKDPALSSLNFDRLPLHSYLISWVLRLWNNPLLASRCLHLIFGVLTLVPFYKFIYLDFGKISAVYSSLLLVFFPMHIKLSVVTLSEAPFMFFIISSVYFLSKYRKVRGGMINIVVSAFMLMLASLLRYEGWILIFLFILFLNVRKIAKDKHMLVFVLITSMGPILWIVLQYMYQDFPFNFVYGHIALKLPAEFFPVEFAERLIYWPGRLYIDFKSIALLLSIAGLIYFLFLKKRNRLIALCFLVLFAFYTIGALTRTIGLHYEYISNAEIFLIPFTVSWIASLSTLRKVRITAISFATFICIFSFVPGLAEIINTMHFFYRPIN